MTWFSNKTREIEWADVPHLFIAQTREGKLSKGLYHLAWKENEKRLQERIVQRLLNQAAGLGAK